LIPIGDDNTNRRGFPVVTITLIILNVIMFYLEWQNGDDFVTRYSVVPRDFTDGGSYPWVTLFSAMFMHGGLAHIAGNMLYLYVFGDNVEDEMGSMKYLAFYLLAGIAATYAQIYADPMSQIPNLGASGAISGVLGAYLVLHPRNRVRVWFGWFVFHVPAFMVLGLYIVTQVISATASTMDVPGQGGVAYMAHVGGFVAGVILVFFFRNPRHKEPTTGFGASSGGGRSTLGGS
jgi:membrane associated rhomboid family serine protease